ncbi:MAG: D-2-hydroxyacid dehydrogenase [Bryobacterales bacterium]
MRKRIVVFLVALFLVAVPLLLAQPKKIVVVGLSADDIQELQKANPNVRIVPGLPPEQAGVTPVTPDAPTANTQRQELLREVADADAFIGGPTREVLQAAKKLKWVQVLSAGVENYQYPELMNSDIVLTNGKKIASPGIADHAMAMLLSLTRKMTHFIAVRPKEEWVRDDYALLELKGKTALVIGVGGIGSNVARRAWAFDMKVIGVDIQQMNPTPFVERFVYPDRLDEVLPQADVVFMCVPHTPKSEGMMGPGQFKLMKKGSYFIAVSRGKTYSLNGLVEALDSKRLAGAGVDVTDPEPLPKGHALWKFDNVIITPHIATQGDGEIPRRMVMIQENVARFANGEQLINVVNKREGF